MRILDPAVNQLMKDNAGYDIELELTTPDQLTMGLKVKPEEVFTYNTTKSKKKTNKDGYVYFMSLFKRLKIKREFSRAINSSIISLMTLILIFILLSRWRIQIVCEDCKESVWRPQSQYQVYQDQAIFLKWILQL